MQHIIPGTLAHSAAMPLETFAPAHVHTVDLQRDDNMHLLPRSWHQRCADNLHASTPRSPQLLDARHGYDIPVTHAVGRGSSALPWVLGAVGFVAGFLACHGTAVMAASQLALPVPVQPFNPNGIPNYGRSTALLGFSLSVGTGGGLIVGIGGLLVGACLAG